MTIISSFRPHKDSAVYRENQIRAHKSWESVAAEIVYFGKPEPELGGVTTRFLPCEEWPKIAFMAEWAATYKEPAAIVNSDIVLEEPVARVFDIVKRTHIGAATSRRFDLETRKLNPEDHGRDIFICKPKIWKMVAKEIPDVCRIGHQCWDGWFVGFLRKRIGKRFADFTQLRAVFHPTHGERLMPYSEEIRMNGEYYGYFDGTQDSQIA